MNLFGCGKMWFPNAEDVFIDELARKLGKFGWSVGAFDLTDEPFPAPSFPPFYTSQNIPTFREESSHSRRKRGEHTCTSRVPESTIHTVETVIIQSGAVITVSGAVYTAGAAVTTTFSGQMGDFAAGAGATTLGVNNDAGSSTSVPNSSSPGITASSSSLITMSTLVAGALIVGVSCVLV